MALAGQQGAVQPTSEKGESFFNLLTELDFDPLV